MDPLVGEFGVLLGAAALLERIAGRELERRCGIRHAVFETLLHLAEGPRSMGDLSASLILTSGGTTRLVDRMEAAGLVTRETAKGDRRRQVVRLTAAGESKLSEALEVHAETLRAHFAAPLADEARQATVESLRTLRAHAREELGTLR